MVKWIIGAVFALAAAPAWAIDVGHDCAEGADEYIVAGETDKPKPPAGS